MLMEQEKYNHFSGNYCLNPCSNGMLMELISHLEDIEYNGLNPCSNGMLMEPF